MCAASGSLDERAAYARRAFHASVTAARTTMSAYSGRMPVDAYANVRKSWSRRNVVIAV